MSRQQRNNTARAEALDRAARKLFDKDFDELGSHNQRYLTAQPFIKYGADVIHTQE